MNPPPAQDSTSSALATHHALSTQRQAALQIGGPRPLQRLRRVSRNGRRRPRDSAFHRRPFAQAATSTTYWQRARTTPVRVAMLPVARAAALVAALARVSPARPGPRPACAQRWAPNPSCRAQQAGGCWKVTCCCRMMKSPCGGSCGPGRGCGSASGCGCLTCCGWGCGPGRPPCHCARRPARRPPRERPPLALLPSRAPPPRSRLPRARPRPPLLLGLLLLEPLTCLRARARRLPPAVSLVYRSNQPRPGVDLRCSVPSCGL